MWKRSKIEYSISPVKLFIRFQFFADASIILVENVGVRWMSEVVRAIKLLVVGDGGAYAYVDSVNRSLNVPAEKWKTFQYLYFMASCMLCFSSIWLQDSTLDGTWQQQLVYHHHLQFRSCKIKRNTNCVCYGKNVEPTYGQLRFH